MKSGTVVQLVASITITLVAIFCFAQAEFTPSDQLPASAAVADDDDIQLTKRPFCNAFTGCGRKRSEEGEAGAERDAFIQKLGRQLLRQAQQNKLNTKNQFRTPWLDYLSDRKKRSAPINNNNRYDDENLGFRTD